MFTAHSKSGKSQHLIMDSPKFDSIPKYNHSHNYTHHHNNSEANSDKEDNIDAPPPTNKHAKASSSTPLVSQHEKIVSRIANNNNNTSNAAVVFKLTPHKQNNHSRLKQQTSPYSINNSHYHIAKPGLGKKIYQIN